MTFAAPTGLTGTNPSGLQVDLTWTAPPSVGSPVLLLHFEDGNGSSAFTDSSPSAQNWSAANGAVESTAKSKFGTGSYVTTTTGLNGPVPYKTLAASNDPIDLHAASSWTIEGWFIATNVASLNIFDIGNLVSGTNSAGVWITTSGGVNLQASIWGATVGGSVPSPGSVSSGVWHHFALVKAPSSGTAGDMYQLFLDGVGGGWSNTTTPYQGPYSTWGGQEAVIAGYYDQSFGGFIQGANQGLAVDEVRVSASAIYTANFTPPTAPFSNTGTAPTGYDIYRNGPSIATTVGGPGYNDVVPVPGTYTYTVAAQTAGVDSSPQSSPFTITIGASLGTTPIFLNDEGIGGAYVNSKLTLVEYVYLPEREPFLEGATNLIINRYKQEPGDVRQRGVDYTYFAVPGELLQTVAVTGISAQGVPQASTNPLVTPLVVTGLIIDPVTQLKFAYTVSGGQAGVEYTVQFTTTTQIQTSNVEEIFSINILVENSFP